MPSSYSLVFTLVLRGYKDISEVIIIIFFNVLSKHNVHACWEQEMGTITFAE